MARPTNSPHLRKFISLIGVWLLLSGLLLPGQVQAQPPAAPQLSALKTEGTVRAAVLLIGKYEATPAAANVVMDDAWLDPGCFGDYPYTSPSIRLGDDGTLSGTCHAEENYMGTHYIYTGTLNGTIKNKTVSFTAEIKMDYVGDLITTKDGQEIGRHTEKGSITGKYTGNGTLDSADHASGLVEFALDCQASMSNMQGEVPYGVDGNCAGSTQRTYATSDSGQVAGSTVWGMDFQDITVRTPVIFIPGIAGTELIDARYNEYLWPFAPVSNRLYLVLKDDGQKPAFEEQNHAVKPGDILRSGATNFYGSLITMLNDSGYKEGIDLFTMPYDWRLSNDTQFGLLGHWIDEATRITGVKKVILIAHSMGGVIARGYIYAKPEYAARVKALITIGTPYWGAPKAFYAAVNGYQFGNITVRKELMKIIGQNWPAAFQLMPRMPFVIDTVNHSMLSLTDTYSLRYKWFTGATERYIWRDKYDTTTENIMTLNPALVQKANDFYASVGTRADPGSLPAGIEQYAIVGCGVKTLGAYDMRDWESGRDGENNYLELADGTRVVLEPRFLDGDGTVPLWSAETPVATSTYYINYKKGSGNSSGHADLPGNTTVQGIVRAILSDMPLKSELYPYPYQKSKPNLTDLEGDIVAFLTFNGYSTDFTLHSDAHLKITNPAGQAVGFTGEDVVDEGIPGSSFLEMDSGEYASIPYQTEPYHVELTGFREGKFALQITTTTLDGKQSTLTFPETPVKPGTQAVIDLPADPAAEPAPLMNVTTDGTSSQVTPQLTIKDVPSASQQEAAAGSGLPDNPSGPENGTGAQKNQPAAQAGQGSTLFVWAGICGVALFAGGCLIILGLIFLRRRKPTPAFQSAAAASPGHPQVYSPSPPPAPPYQPQAPVYPRLSVRHGQMNPPWLELSIPRVIIGGEPGQCTVVVYDPLASRQHASLDFSNGMWVLTDLYSANGTYVNGARIGRHVLRPGDCILIGRTELLFH